MQLCSDINIYSKMTSFEKLSTFLDEREAFKIKVVENNDRLIDLRSINTETNIKLSNAIDDFLLRKSATERLLLAAQNLFSIGLKIEVIEAYRNYNQQKEKFDSLYVEYIKRNPKKSTSQVRAEVSRFIADPDLCPPHLTGGAIDVRLLDSITGKIIDMGSDINIDNEKSYIGNNNISCIASKNRKILLIAMLSVGFAPVATEWWHYSYGDRYWAAFNNKIAIFDTIREPYKLPRI